MRLKSEPLIPTSRLTMLMRTSQYSVRTAFETLSKGVPPMMGP